MKLLKRKGTTTSFQVEAIEKWGIDSFYQWQQFLERCGVPVPSVGDYNLETTLDHFIAIAQVGRDSVQIVGTAQVVTDTQDRHHIHRMVVDPEWRGRGVSDELTRNIDFFYSNVDLYAHVDDDTPLARLLDVYLFTEADNEAEPDRFDLEQHASVQDEHPGEPGRDGEGGAGGTAVEDPEGQDSSPPRDRQNDRPRRRGSRGGRRRGKKGKEE